MATAWTLTAQGICNDALEHLNVLGSGATATAPDMQLALKALDGVLKELPLFGYVWPKLSGEVALTWGGTGVQTIALPADYYGYPVAWKLLNGQRVPLKEIPHGDWVQMLDRATTGPVTHFYISPARVSYLYPTPTAADPTVTLQYQKIVDDAATTTSPDVLQFWINPLGYGVANEMKFKFGLSKSERDDIERMWSMKRSLALASSISSAPISFEVDEASNSTNSPLSY